MLKTIGQLTLERDFLQDCFRCTGRGLVEALLRKVLPSAPSFDASLFTAFQLW